LPIVFLHAFPLSQRMWDGAKTEFSKHFRVLTLDFPGFGGSAAEGDVSTMDRLAQAVLDTLVAAGVTEKKVFVGLSMGGYVLIRLIKRLPDQVRAAVFVSTRTAADTPEARAKRFKNIETVESRGLPALVDRLLPSLIGETTLKTVPAVVESIRAMALAASPAGVCAALRGMAGRPDSTEVLKNAAFPALFVAGSEDTVVPPAEMEGLAAFSGRFEFRRIERAGHLLNLEQPGLFNDALSTFLKRKVL
jgi:pimeloyl-ACP methyl ester carboxylesterase